jgi:hypothetical protein
MRTAVGEKKRRISITFIALQSALLVNCGGEPRLAPPNDLSLVPTSATPAVPLATPTGEISMPQLGEIVWATAIDPATSAPTDAVVSYVPDAPQIIAAATAHSLPSGSRLEATWEYNDTPLEAFTTQLVASDSINETWVSFHIERDPDVPWPEGTYEVTIAFDGTSIQQAAVEVIEQA